MSRKTGYDVYGFAERISTLGIKIGPSFRIGEYHRWGCVVNPFIGMIRYSVKDDSNNSIGARDEYGTKEKSFIGGCKISAVYRNWMLGVNYSNREYGITLGFDIPCFL